MACAILLALLPLAAALGSPPATAAFVKTVDEGWQVPNGEYQFVNLYYTNPPQELEIELEWESTVQIDVWLMDRDNFDLFYADQPFTYDLAQNGFSGKITFHATLAMQAHGSMYVVVENGYRGDTDPPPAGGPTAATINVTGKLWAPEPVYTPQPGSTALLLAMELAVVLLPVGVIVFFVVRRVRRKDRHEDIRYDLDRGMVVGDGAPQNPEAIAASRAPAPAPGMYGAPAGGAPPPAAPSAQPGGGRCPSCGSAVLSGRRFCGQCGARLG